MPRYFCDYCDVYLTHDSAPGRKQHIRGWKHRENVKQYYEQYMKQFYEQNSGMGMTMPGMAMGSLGALTAGRAPMGLLGMQRPGVAPPLALMGAPGSIPRPPLGYPRPPLGVPPPMGSIPVWKSTSASGARQFFTKSFLGDDAAVLARSSGEERHRQAIEQASRRRRGGRRGDSRRTRRK